MIDPAQMLERAAAQLRGLEGLMRGKTGEGRGSPFDPSVWRDLEEAAAAMTARMPMNFTAPGAPPTPSAAPGAAMASPAPRAPVAQFTGYPPIDLFVTDGRVVVNAALPGIEQPQELQVALLGEARLRLSGTVPPHPLKGRAAGDLAEQLHGPFTRIINLPVPVRPDTARCFYHNGLLEVWLDRKQETERTVPVGF